MCVCVSSKLTFVRLCVLTEGRLSAVFVLLRCAVRSITWEQFEINTLEEDFKSTQTNYKQLDKSRKNT